MASDPAELARLRAAVETAEAETASVRTKLHSAIRKGRAIEAEKNTKSEQLEALQQQIDELKCSKSASQPREGGSQTYQQQIEALKRQLQQAQEQSESQAKDSDASAEGQTRELKSRAEYIDKLEDLLKGRQRALAEKQGECIMAQAAAEGYKQDAEAATVRLQQFSSQRFEQSGSDSTDSTADRYSTALLAAVLQPIQRHLSCHPLQVTHICP